MHSKITPRYLHIELPIDWIEDPLIYPAYAQVLKEYIESIPSSFTGFWPLPEIPREGETIDLGERLFNINVTKIRYRWEKTRREVDIAAEWANPKVSMFDLLDIAQLGLGLDHNKPIRDILRAARLPTTSRGYSRKWPQAPR